MTRDFGSSVVRGVLGAMAMTGMRRVTTGLGLLRKPPPEAVADEGAPRLFARVPQEHRDEAIEVAHWAYGAAAGATFALLPARARRQVWAGPLYGVTIWLAFELAVSPALGLSTPRRWRVSDHMAVAADHVLYGFVVGGRPRR